MARFFGYVPHEDNQGDHNGGTRDVVADHYYSSGTPLFILEDLQALESRILFYLLDPDGKYDIRIDIGDYTGGTN